MGTIYQAKPVRTSFAQLQSHIRNTFIFIATVVTAIMLRAVEVYVLFLRKNAIATHLRSVDFSCKVCVAPYGGVLRQLVEVFYDYKQRC